MRIRLWAIFGAACCLALSAVQAAETLIGAAAREYMAVRTASKAPTLTAADVDGPRGPWRGRTVEVYGRVVGLKASGGREPACLLLQFPQARNLLLIEMPEPHSAIALDAIIHALVFLPPDSKSSDRFVLKAAIREEDLPVAERRYAAAMAPNSVGVALQLAQQVALSAASKEAKLSVDIEAAAPPAQAAQPGTDSIAAQQPATPLRRPGTEMPRPAWPNAPDYRVDMWKQWVSRQNPKLTDNQLELIVRAVLYYSALYGVDHRLSFAMIKCESNFDPSCVSSAGAIGLTQLMPGTAKSLGVNPWDLEQNIEGGIRYLSQQLYAYAGRSNYEQFALGMASYNAGPNAVKRAGGIPNIPETIRYVKKVGDLFVELYKTMP